MLLVVADTSPIRYLVLIGHVEILERLFERVSIPADVANELRDPSAPASVRAWMEAAPAWLDMREVAPTDDAHLMGLDPGERSAIALGLALKADLILIDERRGARAALHKGLETTGTLGLPDLAARNGLIDLADAIERLKSTNFRYRQEIIDALLASQNRK
jgi:predicted nucleic acid-binding protein